MTATAFPAARRGTTHRLLALALPAAWALAAGCADDTPGMGGGAVEAPGELPALAEGYLATDRPWRASRAMRRYLAEVDDPPADARLLAARSEAGWGAWDEALRLLEGLGSAETLEGGQGLWLLGRARDETGDAAGAVEAYRAYLALPATPDGGGDAARDRAAARLRLALAALRAGGGGGAGDPGAGGALDEVRRDVGEASVWIDVLEADARARTGDTAGVRRAVSAFDDGILGLRARRARVEAARSAGDHAAARELANAARRWASTDVTRSEFLVEAGREAVAMGDVGAGRDAFRAAVDADPGGAHARRAVALLRDGGGGGMSPADHLAVARALAAQGLHEQAVEGFRTWLRDGGGSAAERRRLRLELGEALFYAQRYDEVADAVGSLSGQDDGRFLLARAAEWGGRPDDAARLYLEVADLRGGSARGGLALLQAAGVLHDDGQVDGARELYRSVVEQYPGSDVAGVATMRLAGIAFLDGDYTTAGRLWDGYRSRYPSGTRALQSTYWAGRAREAAGDSAGAADLFRRVRAAERDSYYALMASQRLGEPFWPLPMGPDPEASPGAAARVEGWMEAVDLLRTAGFPAEAAEEARRVAGRAGDDATRYAVAEALASRGYAQSAILMAIRLEGRDGASPRVLRARYPFPYRTLVTEEARERGVDPFVEAALIRQESLFEVRNTSHVGARGLMQLMPATGAEVAADEGIDPWDAETLYEPEMNVHLGTALLARHLEAYDGSLPAVFSAYNAGPHRVERWRRYPEFEADQELFTERIPFRETRDYVKTLLRNRALYEGLYGPGGGSS